MAGSFAGMSHALVAPLPQWRGRTRKDGMAENEPDEDPKSPHDARLDSLDERLRRAQADEAARTGVKQSGTVAYYRSPAYRVLSVLIGYPLGTRVDRLCDRSLRRHAGRVGRDGVPGVRRRDLGNLEAFEAEPAIRARGKDRSGGRDQDRSDASVPDQPARGQSGRQLPSSSPTAPCGCSSSSG